MWELRFQRDGFALEVQLARKQPLPEWYRDEPVLRPGDEFYIHAFWDLSTERQVGFSIGPIPHSKVVEYGLAEGLDSDSMEVFVPVIRGMDGAYMKWFRDEQERLRKHAEK